MINKIENSYALISPKKSIVEFINKNENTLEILTTVKPLLDSYFPNSKLSLEISEDIEWSSENKAVFECKRLRRDIFQWNVESLQRYL